jgi:hypothetical protein
MKTERWVLKTKGDSYLRKYKGERERERERERGRNKG